MYIANHSTCNHTNSYIDQLKNSSHDLQNFNITLFTRVSLRLRRQDSYFK